LEVGVLEFGSWNLEFGILKSVGIWNFGIGNSKLAIRNSEFGI